MPLPPPSLQHATVLLLDDEPTVLNVLSDYFAQHGVSADCAADLTAACSRLRDHRYRVVVADLRLSPEQDDPLEALTVLRQGWPEVRVIVFSGCSSQEVRRRALAMGAFAFVQKPAPAAELLALARQAQESP